MAVSRRQCVALLVAVLAAPVRQVVAQAPPAVRLRAGLVITQSVRVVPGAYRIAAPVSLEAAVITVRGDDITLDLSGATLDGARPGADPDQGAGVAIRVEGGRNVRIVHGRVRGYHIAILARGTRGLTLDSNELSHNWKPRLYSLVEHESLADWQSYHHNENGEWLRFGGALVLADVSGAVIRDNTAQQGGNGLLLMRSDRVRVEANDFSFNSSLGIGLYRSSDNVIVGNRVDYAVRGYSHGFYRRGQDSAGILLYEQSCRNLIAWNSATHGGDGFFLWAGQTTMDSGTGGANDNVVYGNDFSFAPANAIEATFSRNTFVANLLEGSDYGVWGGYSFNTVIAGNRFAGNRIGVAIEHGQENVIASNRFRGETTAIQLWADSIAPSDWGYPRRRDTRGRDVMIEANVFTRHRVGVRASNTRPLAIERNRWDGVDSLLVLRDTAGIRVGPNEPLAAGDTMPDGMPALPAELRGYAPAGEHGRVPSTPAARRDRSAIIVDEWGPFDWRSPRLWPVDSARAVPLRLAVVGPEGSWRVVSRRGVAVLSAPSGRVGDTLGVTPSPRSPGDWEVTLEYRGEATVSPAGVRRVAGEPYRFSYGRYEPAINWSVRFYVWTDSSDPRAARSEGFQALLRGPPLLERRASRLDYMWYRPTLRELPQERFATVATGTVTLPRGVYTLRTISDDGVRVWVDRVLVIDDWVPHESKVDNVPLAAGRHAIRVEHYQAGGWTELRLDIVRGRQRSAGTPGPH